MRPRRFDKQFQSVFMVLSGLTILVGLASIGVNRFLARTQAQVLGSSIAIIERTERVASEADLAGSLAEQLALSWTGPEITRTAGTLTAKIDGIAADIAAMRQFLAGAAGEPGVAADARALVARMSETVQRLRLLEASIRTEKHRLADAGQRLSEGISAERDLARLRITAGIWELYSMPADRNQRPGLDRLADVDFFAFERLGDLAAATATLTALVQEIADADTAADIVPLRTRFRDTVDLADARTRFMPTSKGRGEADRNLAILASADADGGLIALQLQKVSTSTALAQQSEDLGVKLAVLTAEAARGRNETRARMKERVAAAGWQAMILTAGLVAIVMVAVLAGILVWMRTRAGVVRRLGAVAERIVTVARGEIGAPMPVSGHDEIGRLEKALNILRRRTEEAARLRSSLESAVLARTADVVAEMQSANAARAEAEEQSRAKTHFLARMSHEIRTPLNGVIGLLDLLVGEEADPVRRARAETALTSARDLQSMTEDLLAFSSGEDSRAEAGLAVFDPTRLARGLGAHLEVLARAKGLLPVVAVAGDLPPGLLGKPVQVRQVVMNLLSNAVKYTEAGEVALTVESRPCPGGGMHEISFAIADTGPGMTAEEARHAFDIYGRSMDARRKGIPGVGLGLAIVRQLTDAMGGELRVSTQPGQGSRFTLVLRLAEAAAPADEAASGMVPPGLRVLVIDDHPVNRLVARGYLERMGCRVAEAATGGEALARAAEADFDAILIDLDLPDMRGEEVAERIGRNGARLAILTADLVSDDAETRGRFGVDAALTKPISPRALVAFLAGRTGAEDAAPARGAEEVLREDAASLGEGPAAEIVAAFLADLAAAVPALLKAPDAEARRRIAHRLKGAASNFALDDLCGLMRRLEAGDAAALDGLEAAAEAAGRALRVATGRVGLQLPDEGAKQ
ncbi:ATP-binding protein [Albidovulum sp.]|uniref:ATP-binding protein n=1 Tax=Albidovulum sp. TaxID=1872424 RepID=UPI0039B8DE4E